MSPQSLIFFSISLPSLQLLLPMSITTLLPKSTIPTRHKMHTQSCLQFNHLLVLTLVSKLTFVPPVTYLLQKIFADLLPILFKELLHFLFTAYIHPLRALITPFRQSLQSRNNSNLKLTTLLPFPHKYYFI